MNKIIDRFSTLVSGYVNFLGRLPDWDGIANHFSTPCPTSALIDQIIQCDEYSRVNSAVTSMEERLSIHGNKKRVLLFGAFGNGNLGDRIMAETVVSHLERSADVVCFAYSELNSAPYPFTLDRRLSCADMPLNFRVMALFDAIIIGGGGLLSYSHEPLWDPSWAYTIPVPYGLLSCGVKVPLDNRLENLVHHASVASSRDFPGFKELATRRKDALLCPDPVLSFAPIASPESKPDKGRLFILRAPFCDWHRGLKAHLGPRDSIAVFEAHMDHEIISCFHDVHSINTKEEFYELVKNHEVTISERYHGTILSLLAGVPAYGILRDSHSDKILSLFEELGVVSRTFEIENAEYEFPPYALEDVRSKLQAIRSNAVTAYHCFMDNLLSGASPKPTPVTRTRSEAISRRLDSMGQVYSLATASLQIEEEALYLEQKALAGPPLRPPEHGQPSQSPTQKSTSRGG